MFKYILLGVSLIAYTIGSVEFILAEVYNNHKFIVYGIVDYMILYSAAYLLFFRDKD